MCFNIEEIYRTNLNAVLLDKDFCQNILVGVKGLTETLSKIKTSARIKLKFICHSPRLGLIFGIALSLQPDNQVCSVFLA